MKPITHLDKLSYSKKEAAQVTSLSPRTIGYLIERGDLRARKIGKRTVIPASDLKRLVEGGLNRRYVRSKLEAEQAPPVKSPGLRIASIGNSDTGD